VVDWTEHATAATSGDRSAWDTLARLVWPSVRRWALLELGDETLADDAAQESLVRLFRHLGTWRRERPFGPWLHAVVRNAARDVFHRHPRPVVPLLPEPSAAPTVDRDVDLQRAAAHALAAFERCTPRQRQLIDLCDRQGLSPAEAAELLDIEPGTARALLHQARTTVRRRVLAACGDDVTSLLHGSRDDL
jgi:RNA polymerase sigma-70 factor (ECF subfamily)